MCTVECAKDPPLGRINPAICIDTVSTLICAPQIDPDYNILDWRKFDKHLNGISIFLQTFC
ncbi:MAG: hypothetical protein COB90_08025 [Hyphomicrobiales bacterium]|nr:MAG: hypothetical protein COB90_08025 [Hyphomicrobiales bacterium]